MDWSAIATRRGYLSLALAVIGAIVLLAGICTTLIGAADRLHAIPGWRTEVSVGIVLAITGFLIGVAFATVSMASLRDRSRAERWDEDAAARDPRDAVADAWLSPLRGGGMGPVNRPVQAAAAAPAPAVAVHEREPAPGDPEHAFGPEPARYDSGPGAFEPGSVAYEPEPASYQAETAAYAPGPAVYQAEPAVHAAEPAGYESEPVGYEAERPVYRREPAAYPAEPVGYEAETPVYRREPAAYPAEPVGYESETPAYQPEPAPYEPAAYDAEPAAYEAEFAAYEPEPAAYHAEFAAYEPEPAAYEPEPVRYEAGPGEHEPGPEAYPHEPFAAHASTPDTAFATERGTGFDPELAAAFASGPHVAFADPEYQPESAAAFADDYQPDGYQADNYQPAAAFAEEPPGPEIWPSEPVEEDPAQVSHWPEPAYSDGGWSFDGEDELARDPADAPPLPGLPSSEIHHPVRPLTSAHVSGRHSTSDTGQFPAIRDTGPFPAVRNGPEHDSGPQPSFDPGQFPAFLPSPVAPDDELALQAGESQPTQRDEGN